MSWMDAGAEHQRERHTSRRVGVASFDLFRIGGHDVDTIAEMLEEAVFATPGVFSARVDVTNSRLVVTYGDPGALVAVEDVVRSHGFSTDPDEAADVARDWQEFLRNDRLGDD